MRISLVTALLVTVLPVGAFAQPAPAEPTPAPAPPAPSATAPAPTAPPPPAGEPAPTAPAVAAEPATTSGPTITIGGYVEEYYQLHAQDPSNRITNLRYDNRSRTFTLSNVALDVKGEAGPVATHIVFQVGHTPSSYYLAEPVSPGTASVDTSNGDLWRFLQAANLTAKAPHDILIEAGLFPSPIGLEVIPIKDNWNWSRSNVFFNLPTYHTGVMVSHPIVGGWIGKVHVYNGWNSVVDNNGYPSLALSAAYSSSKTSAQLMYFGGIERPDGAPEGRAWRSLFDALVQTAITETVSLAAQGDAGFEPNNFGTDAWAAIAGYAKLQLCPTLYAAVRGDYFYEKVPAGASPVSLPVKWVAEGTATLAYQPIDHASVRLEYRHDQAAANAYFGGDVAIDPMTMAFVPDRDMQDTVTLGVTAWF